MEARPIRFIDVKLSDGDMGAADSRQNDGKGGLSTAGEDF